MFEDYTWDTGDFARKEIVRYMSDPGQATAYMLGRLELIKMRQKATKALGKKFNLKDFHYQVVFSSIQPSSASSFDITLRLFLAMKSHHLTCVNSFIPIRSQSFFPRGSDAKRTVSYAVGR